jgi:hypothetical protein
MARSSRTFATITSSPSSCRCSLVQIEIRSRLHRDACQRRPENLVSPFFVTWLKRFVANSEVAHNSRLAIRKSTVILLGVEECLRQFGCTKHIRDAL